MATSTATAPSITLAFEDWCADEHERDVCKRYWERLPDGSFAHTIKSLAKEVREPEHSFDYYVLSRCKARSEMTCGCGAAETHEFEFRKELDELRERPWTCKACTKKRLDVDMATRAPIAAERNAERQAAEELEQARREQLRNDLQDTHPLGQPKDPQSVRLRLAMYWYALVCPAEKPWIWGIPAVAKSVPRWVGDDVEEQEILENLLDAGLLYIDRDSLISADLDTDFPFRQFRWRLSAPEYEEFARAYVTEAKEVMPNPGSWPNHWRDEYVELFEEIAGMECRRYWRDVQRQLKIIGNVDDEFSSIMKEALTLFSVEQIARILWGSANTAKTWSETEHRFPHHEVAHVTMRVLRKRIRRSMEAPPKQKETEFRRYPRGFATEVTLSIMSGTEAPWYTVSMRDVHDLLRVDAVDGSYDAEGKQGE